MHNKCDYAPCGHEHRYFVFSRDKEGRVSWFCSQQCRSAFECEDVEVFSLREFARSGGWV